MAQHRRSAHSRGFTLIELLVVITIITLLIAILLPALVGARAAARQVKCQSMLRQFAQANHSYAMSHNDYCIPMHDGTQSPAGLSGPFGVLWTQNRLARELMGGEVLGDLALPVAQASEAHERWSPTYLCPDATRAARDLDAFGRAPMRLSYGQNYGGFGGIVGSVSGSQTFLGSPPRPIAAYRLTQIRRPTESMFMADGLDWLLDAGFQGYTNEDTNSFGIAFRHPGFASNLSCFDGHVYARPRAAFNATNAEGAKVWNVGHVNPSTGQRSAG